MSAPSNVTTTVPKDEAIQRHLSQGRKTIASMFASVTNESIDATTTPPRTSFSSRLRHTCTGKRPISDLLSLPSGTARSRSPAHPSSGAPTLATTLPWGGSAQSTQVDQDRDGWQQLHLKAKERAEPNAILDKIYWQGWGEAWEDGYLKELTAAGLTRESAPDEWKSRRAKFRAAYNAVAEEVMEPLYTRLNDANTAIEEGYNALDCGDVRKPKYDTTILEGLQYWPSVPTRETIDAACETYTDTFGGLKKQWQELYHTPQRTEEQTAKLVELNSQLTELVCTTYFALAFDEVNAQIWEEVPDEASNAASESQAGATDFALAIDDANGQSGQVWEPTPDVETSEAQSGSHADTRPSIRSRMIKKARQIAARASQPIRR